MSEQPARVHAMAIRARASAIAAGLRRDLCVVALAARAPEVPVPAKLCAIAVAAYAVSPIDLIPDFLPVIGLLDDLLLLPLGIWVTLRLIPASIRQDLRQRARDGEPSGPRGLGAVLVVGLWLAVLLATAALLETPL